MLLPVTIFFQTNVLKKKVKLSKKGHLPASLVPLDIEELSDSVVSGRFRLFPELLCVKTEADPEELKKR